MEEKFWLDGCDLGKKEIECSRCGDLEGSWACKQEILEKLKGKDHCSCPQKCPHHGNCYECVIFHRAHQDHLPYCFWGMVNDRIDSLTSLTEGSYCNNDK